MMMMMKIVIIGCHDIAFTSSAFIEIVA